MSHLLKIFSVIFVMCFLCVFSAQAEDVGKILSITPDNVPRYVETIKGVKLVFIYASWCPTCRKVMPDVVQLSTVNPKSIIALSVDEDAGQLLQYISENYGGKFPLGTTPIVVKEKNSGHLRDILRSIWRTDIGEGIPSMVLLDADNNVIAQGTNITNEAATVISKP